ncbi:hypothetical protein MRB53_023261 [Persea americana]|uniref:Uncharacterized protein n=1 Tax=Persea americana TaxID=3435 RepID=A0ACC2LA49_PERAE|nr:hypothetical protein MRB53_023261 [Persea americana]
MHSSDGSGKILNLDLVSSTSTDRLVKAWITRTLSEEVLGLAVRLKTAADVWRSLTEAAFSQSSQAQEFELLSKLQYLKKGTFSLFEYLREFNSVCDQLNAIGKLVFDQKKGFMAFEWTWNKIQVLRHNNVKTRSPFLY